MEAKLININVDDELAPDGTALLHIAIPGVGMASMAVDFETADKLAASLMRPFLVAKINQVIKELDNIVKKGPSNDNPPT